MTVEEGGAVVKVERQEEGYAYEVRYHHFHLSALNSTSRPSEGARERKLSIRVATFVMASASVRFCEGLRMPAFCERRRALGPASGSLQGRNPRDGECGFGAMGI